MFMTAHAGWVPLLAWVYFLYHIRQDGQGWLFSILVSIAMTVGTSTLAGLLWLLVT